MITTGKILGKGLPPARARPVVPTRATRSISFYEEWTRLVERMVERQATALEESSREAKFYTVIEPVLQDRCEGDDDNDIAHKEERDAEEQGDQDIPNDVY